MLTSGAQFRPVEVPHVLTSPVYTADYNEVKALGAANSLTRTPDQTQIGLFWLENAEIGWNRIARMVAAGQPLDAWAYARLFALLHVTLSDTYIAVFDGKYHFNLWRPITAIGNHVFNHAFQKGVPLLNATSPKK
ncbi:hypothetical protein GCM10023187_12950 [Nibrella viscosa]|uniref:Uncharacterized protein n=1 Tax=Nibrella viscosa TaxID=1084524 RepID=A0ABP8K4N9_9BACT